MIEKITNNKYCDSCKQQIEEQRQAKKIKSCVCIDCGKEFIISSKNNNTVRCTECQKKYEYTPIEEVQKCTKCGKEFIKKGKTKRDICDECYKEYRTEYYKENKRKQRMK